MLPAVKLHRTAALAALALVALAAPGAPPAHGAGGAATVPVYAAEPGAEGASPFQDGAWKVEAPAYVAELRLLDDATRPAFVERRTGSREDPFASIPGQKSSLLTFLLRIENKGRGDLVFEPDATRMIGREHEAWYPVGWPDIQSAYELLGREVPPLQARARPLLLDGQKVIRPGGVEEGILLFRQPPAGSKRFRIEVGLTLPDGSGAGLAAPYRLVKK
jgi:hypothetical protein